MFFFESPTSSAKLNKMSRPALCLGKNCPTKSLVQPVPPNSLSSQKFFAPPGRSKIHSRQSLQHLLQQTLHLLESLQQSHPLHTKAAALESGATLNEGSDHGGQRQNSSAHE